MQETKELPILPPDQYDWSEFSNKERGFLAEWCRDHEYINGEEFRYKTVYALIKGDYTGEAGPKIQQIIRMALEEGLIVSIERRDKERRAKERREIERRARERRATA